MSGHTRGDEVDLLLETYLDGELGRIALWRLERRLERSAELRARLDALTSVGNWVRDAENGRVPGGAPDMWSEIASDLAGIDRAIEQPTSVGRVASQWFSWSAVAAAAVLVLLLATGLSGIFWDGLGGLPSWSGSAVNNQGALRYLNTDGRPVMVSQDGEDTTIIWLIDSPAPAV